jgi:GT2 family glycosyltransferase
MNQSAISVNPEPGEKGLVTVVIPAFRARRYLPEALASIRAQTFRAWEIIVVDDCSPEPVDDLVNAFAATVPKNVVRLIRHPENKGLGATRNTGIRAAAGEYIAFLDHDDCWRETHLADAVQALESETAALAYCDFELFEEKPGDRSGTLSAGPQPWGPFPGSLYVHNFIPPSGVVMRKRVLEELNLFATDPEIHMCEDLDLWLRAAGRGVKFVRVPKPNLLYRKHPQSATSSPRTIADAKAEVICRNLTTVPQVPFSFRLERLRVVCTEAAKGHGWEEPARTAYFYALSCRQGPRMEIVWMKHALAWFFYRTLAALGVARAHSQPPVK